MLTFIRKWMGPTIAALAATVILVHAQEQIGPQATFTSTVTIASGAQIQCANGTAAAPCYSFTSQSDKGFFAPASSTFAWAINATEQGEFDNTGTEAQILTPGSNRLAFSSGVGTRGDNADVFLSRGAAGQLNVGQAATALSHDGKILSGQITSGGNIIAGSGFEFRFPLSTRMADVADGVLEFRNSAATSFTRLILGTNDATNNGVALKLSSGAVAFRRGDDSGDAAITTGAITNSGDIVPAVNNTTNLGSGGVFWSSAFISTVRPSNIIFGGTNLLTSATDGLLKTTNNAQTVGVEINNGTAAPTPSTCGTGAVTAGSRNAAGEATATGATACTINWGNPNWTNVPFCVIEDETTLQAARVSAISAAAMTVSGLTSGDKFMWVCLGRI
jgi:hypothetical protein